MPIEAIPTTGNGHGDEEEDEPMDEEVHPPSTTPKSQKTIPSRQKLIQWITKEKGDDRHHQQRLGRIRHIQDHIRPKRTSLLHRSGNRHTTMFGE